MQLCSLGQIDDGPANHAHCSNGSEAGHNRLAGREAVADQALVVDCPHVVGERKAHRQHAHACGVVATLGVVCGGSVGKFAAAEVHQTFAVHSHVHAHRHPITIRKPAR